MKFIKLFLSIGNHLINVYWTEHPLVGAPFLGYAVAKNPTVIPDNSQVTLSGRGLKEAVVREEAEFYIDGSKAGPGELSNIFLKLSKLIILYNLQ